MDTKMNKQGTGRPYILIDPDERDRMELTIQELRSALELICSEYPRHRDGMDGQLPVGIKAARVALEKARS